MKVSCPAPGPASRLRPYIHESCVFHSSQKLLQENLIPMTFTCLDRRYETHFLSRSPVSVQRPASLRRNPLRAMSPSSIRLSLILILTLTASPALFAATH